MAQGVKTRDIGKFSEGVAKYLNRECSQVKAAKIAVMSVPTFMKYVNKFLTSEELPVTLFTAKKRLLGGVI